jgi:hypothetical protein
MKLHYKLCFLFLLFASSIFSQVIPIMPDSSATWTTSIWSWAWPWQYHLLYVDQLQIGNDTLISDKLYKRVGLGFFRVEDEKVFYKGEIPFAIGSPDSTEILLYDFGLQVGDTFALTEEYIITVSSIDSIMLNGVNYEKINFADAYNNQGVDGLSPIGPPFTEYCWIKGIGSALGFFPYFPYFESEIQFNCFTKNGEAILLNIETGGTCDNVGLAKVPKDKEIILYPNPSSGIIYLKSDDPMKQVTIYDFMGRVLSVEPPSGNPQNINLSYLKGGIYYLSVSESNLRKMPFVIIH